jgi:hypothetical protein
VIRSIKARVVKSKGDLTIVITSHGQTVQEAVDEAIEQIDDVSYKIPIEVTYINIRKVLTKLLLGVNLTKEGGHRRKRLRKTMIEIEAV